MRGCLLGSKAARLNQVLNQRMVPRDLADTVLPIEIAAAVTRVSDEQIGAEAISQGDRRSHSLELGRLCRSSRDSPVCLSERCLELLNHVLLFRSAQPKEPLECVEEEILDAVDGKSACLTTAPSPAH